MPFLLFSWAARVKPLDKKQMGIFVQGFEGVIRKAMFFLGLV